MSRRGNDLVRRYLWMAALSASRHNPACRALYARVRAKHPDKPAIAIGHVMRKLLHLAFAAWKTRKPFDANYYPWHAPAHLDGEAALEVNQAAGPERGAEPSQQGVTATCDATTSQRVSMPRVSGSTSRTSRSSCRWRVCWITSA